jgi:tetratricopeptide (TPR) repeat protein
MLRVYSAEPKKVLHTWSDRLTGKSNLWLEATNAEDDGNLPQATMLYLRDATKCWEKGLKARAALSCACAAGCFMRTNNLKLAQMLYAEAARMYEAASAAAIDRSIREAFWALQRAYENYVLAGNEAKAQEVYMKYTSLAIRISPFFGREEALKILGFKEAAEEKAAGAVSGAGHMKVSMELLGAVEEFLQVRRSESDLDLEEEMAVMAPVDGQEGRGGGEGEEMGQSAGASSLSPAQKKKKKAAAIAAAAATTTAAASVPKEK